MGDIESLSELLADRIENEQFLSSIGQLKYVRRLSLCGSSSAPPSYSLISTSVLNWKRWLPKPFIEWISVKHLELSNGGLSDRAINCVDFRGLSALIELDLRGNKFSSLPSGIGFLPKLGLLYVHGCKYLLSIQDLPSSLHTLGAAYCKSLERVRIPKSKENLHITLDESHSLEEIQGIKGLSNSLWCIRVDDCNQSSNKLQKSVIEAMCNGRHWYFIDSIPGDYLYSTELTGRIEECGVHVIAEKLDSFEKSEVGRDTVMPSPPPYHLLPHPHCGSIIASTLEQWSDYLFAKLHKYNLHLRLLGDKRRKWRWEGKII